MTGIINVISGKLNAINYNKTKELEEERIIIENDSEIVLKKCELKEIENRIITQGDVSILTPEKGNIHSIMPLEFSQLIDVFTPAHSENTNGKWYNLMEPNTLETSPKKVIAEYPK